MDVYKDIVKILILKLINDINFNYTIEEIKIFISNRLEKISKITDKLKINSIKLEIINDLYESIINA
jgi:hypothetical protein